MPEPTPGPAAQDGLNLVVPAESGSNMHGSVLDLNRDLSPADEHSEPEPAPGASSQPQMSGPPGT